MSSSMPMTIFRLILLFNLLAVINKSDAAIGVNYGTNGNNLPPPSRAVQLIKSSSAGFDRVKIFAYPQDIMSAVANAGLKLAIAIPNQEVAGFRDGSKASNWVKQTVAPFASAVNLVIVGNEVDNGQGDINSLVQAMRTVQDALNQNGLSRIKVTTPLTTGVIQNSYPPSAGTFDRKVSPILNFLASSGSPFMLNVYPYFAWRGDQGGISLDYALFRSNRVVVQDGDKGYTNLFDAMVDAAVAALEKSNHGQMELVVGETGWPNDGGAGASVENARQYNSALVRKVKSNQGTPRRPGPMNVYIFALFNENQKGGDGVEQHWGLYKADGSPVYSLS